jgi:uncharacterized protein YegL
MKKNKTQIVLLVDRSGSMSTIRQDMEGGLTTFIDDQKKVPGEAVVSYYQFDTIFDTIFEEKPIESVEKIKIVPRGGTALLDGIGRAINQVGLLLEKQPEDERPENILFVVITDGMENSSKEFHSAKIKEMIKHQEEKYSWKFVFLGANMDAVSVGEQYGFSPLSSMTYDCHTASVRDMSAVLSMATTSYRASKSFEFSKEDRDKVSK